MGETRRTKDKKNLNRVKASQRPFYSSTQKSYYKKVVKEEKTNKLF